VRRPSRRLRPCVLRGARHHQSDARGVRVRAVHDTDRGGAFVSPVGGHGSHLIGDLAAANALIEVPADVTAIRAGEMVQVRLLDEEF
jgi:molybdopterin molybdotransferase